MISGFAEQPRDPELPRTTECYEVIHEVLSREIFGENEQPETIISLTSEDAPISPDLDQEISNTVEEDDKKPRSIMHTVQRFVGFTAVRYSANLEWALGIAGGETVIQQFDTNRWVTASAVMGGVALLENKQSKWVANRIKKSGEELNPSKDVPASYQELKSTLNTNSDCTSHKRRTVKEISKAAAGLAAAASREILVLGSASWQGAAATVEVNQAHGIESTPARIKVQSLVYGSAVGLWLTPIPPFKQLNGMAREAFGYILDSPVESTTIGAAVSIGIFGILKGYKTLKDKLSRVVTKNKDSTIDSENK